MFEAFFFSLSLSHCISLFLSYSLGILASDIQIPTVNLGLSLALIKAELKIEKGISRKSGPEQVY